MRPYHILLAVRIIILSRLFLLFCVYHGYSFPSTAFFAISDAPLSSSTRLTNFAPPPLHIPLGRPLSLSCVLVFSPVLLVVLRVQSMSRAILSLPPLPSLFLFSHLSDLFRLHLPHDAFCTNGSFSAASQSHPSAFHLPVVYSISSPCLPPIRPWVSLEHGGAQPPLLSLRHTLPDLGSSRS